MIEQTTYQAKDYKSAQLVRWCPGCGDFGVLSSLHKAMAETGVAPHNIDRKSTRLNSSH